MTFENILRRLRGAFGNALVWGVGWVTVGVALLATLRVVGVLSFSWAELLGFAVRLDPVHKLLLNGGFRECRKGRRGPERVCEGSGGWQRL